MINCIFAFQRSNMIFESSDVFSEYGVCARRSVSRGRLLSQGAPAEAQRGGKRGSERAKR